MDGVRAKRPILIVDDDAMYSTMLRSTLEDQGYSVGEASDGAAAIEYLQTHPAPALILLDLWMPGMDGWSFCDLRRRDPDLAGIPVIVVTAHGGASRLAPYVGVEALLAKPVAPNVLLETVERFRLRGAPRRRRQTG